MQHALEACSETVESVVEGHDLEGPRGFCGRLLIRSAYSRRRMLVSLVVPYTRMCQCVAHLLLLATKACSACPEDEHSLR